MSNMRISGESLSYFEIKANLNAGQSMEKNS